MFQFLPGPLLGVLSALVLAANTLLCSLLLYIVALLRLIPVESWRMVCARLSNAIAQGWVGINAAGLRITKDVRWDVQGVESLKADTWYLLVANHQSMVDIVVLQCIFNRRIPPLKFFLKKELIYVPVIGIAWWVLDFPFMKRSTSARKDIETTRKACEKFRKMPVTVMNFLEGTRFTPEKKEKENSPFEHLLKPKPGGMAAVLDTIGNQLHAILDVTIVYPAGVPELWDFLCCKTIDIKVRVKEIPVTGELLGDYFTDRGFRARFKDWLQKLWSDKDESIRSLSACKDK